MGEKKCAGPTVGQAGQDLGLSILQTQGTTGVSLEAGSLRSLPITADPKWHTHLDGN